MTKDVAWESQWITPNQVSQQENRPVSVDYWRTIWASRFWLINKLFCLFYLVFFTWVNGNWRERSGDKIDWEFAVEVKQTIPSPFLVSNIQMNRDLHWWFSNKHTDVLCCFSLRASWPSRSKSTIWFPFDCRVKEFDGEFHCVLRPLI